METTKPRIGKRSLKIAPIAAMLIFALLGSAKIAAEPVLNSIIGIDLDNCSNVD